MSAATNKAMAAARAMMHGPICAEDAGELRTHLGALPRETREVAANYALEIITLRRREARALLEATDKLAKALQEEAGNWRMTAYSNPLTELLIADIGPIKVRNPDDPHQLHFWLKVASPEERGRVAKNASDSYHQLAWKPSHLGLINKGMAFAFHGPQGQIRHVAATAPRADLTALFDEWAREMRYMTPAPALRVYEAMVRRQGADLPMPTMLQYETGPINPVWDYIREQPSTPSAARCLSREETLEIAVGQGFDPDTDTLGDLVEALERAGYKET